ncbi:MAG TPA: GYF domain-containing protein [Kofleriaceae bacterium]
MKFLCDRCKTRYSIGDERVRGKILKIRCKNCANVITVREGMSSEPAAASAGAEERSTQPSAPASRDPAASRAAAARDSLFPAAREPASTAGAARSGAREPASTASTAGGQSGAREPASTAGAAARSGAREPASTAGAAAGRGGAREPASTEESAAGAARSTAAREPAAARVQADAAQARRGAQPDAGRGRGSGAMRAAAEPSGDSVNALNAAFASAMAQPAPAALEEEWYVSIDGEQAGPYSLAVAQRWVADQALDAELHCWSEGFDDWLPIDKVSHFRGLRKRPTAPVAPPPLPRSAVPPPRAAAPVPADDEPKPLFAATMASLEHGAPALSGLGLPPPIAPAARATPPRGTAVAGNGAPGAAAQARPAAGDASPPVGAPAPARGARGNPFDVSESGDAATQLEAMPFEDAPRDPRPSSSDAAMTAPHLPASSTLRGTGASAAATAPPASDFGGDDDFDIGEVSRVVNLADVARAARPLARTTDRPAERSAIADRTGARRTGALAAVRATGPAPSLSGAPIADGDPGMSIAPVVRAHRRGLIALLAVAAVVVLGVIGALIAFVTWDDDATDGSLGAVNDIDTSRPDDPVAHHPVGSAAPAPVTPPTPARPHIRSTPGTAGGQAEAPPGNSLASDEIEEVARKHQEATQRCYLRSQRGADAILIGDVKKIAVTLTIDRDGNISDLQLSEHGADNLGKCLSNAIRGWKFRQSSGGTYRISLAFASG